MLLCSEDVFLRLVCSNTYIYEVTTLRTDLEQQPSSQLVMRATITQVKASYTRPTVY